MLTTSITVQTAKAASYYAQLCKHFGHKLPVTEAKGLARMTFGAGVGQVHYDANGLTLLAEADTVEDLRKVADILGSHLERFAFREDLRVNWPDDAGTVPDAHHD
jgi:hypothetical protein